MSVQNQLGQELIQVPVVFKASVVRIRSGWTQVRVCSYL